MLYNGGTASDYDVHSIAIGEQDFKGLIDTDGYYVDKTRLIARFIPRMRGTYLFTRPRRFGKSLNLSMIDAFFNIEYKGNRWFDDLEISRHPRFEEFRNRFPVLYFDFKDLRYNEYDVFIGNVGAPKKELPPLEIRRRF